MKKMKYHAAHSPLVSVPKPHGLGLWWVTSEGHRSPLVSGRIHFVPSVSLIVRGLAKPQHFTAFPSILGPVTSVAQRESCIACQHVSPGRACSPKRHIDSAKYGPGCSRKDLPQGRVSVGPSRVTPSAFRRGRYKCPRAVCRWVAPRVSTSH